MPRFSLFPDEAAGQPHPVWEIVEAARSERVTGELTFATDPLSRIHLLDGVPYMGERATDARLGVRLMVEGVLTRAQLAQGGILLHGVQDLGHLFERDATIDRAPVEVAIGRLTGELLASLADEVAAYDVRPLHHHPSGIVRWWRPVAVSDEAVEVANTQESLVELALAESGSESVAEEIALGIRRAIEAIEGATRPQTDLRPEDVTSDVTSAASSSEERSEQRA